MIEFLQAVWPWIRRRPLWQQLGAVLLVLSFIGGDFWNVERIAEVFWHDRQGSHAAHYADRIRFYPDGRVALHWKVLPRVPNCDFHEYRQLANIVQEPVTIYTWFRPKGEAAPYRLDNQDFSVKHNVGWGSATQVLEHTKPEFTDYLLTVSYDYTTWCQFVHAFTLPWRGWWPEQRIYFTRDQLLKAAETGMYEAEVRF